MNYPFNDSCVLLKSEHQHIMTNCFSLSHLNAQFGKNVNVVSNLESETEVERGKSGDVRGSSNSKLVL